ncbi:hypothetical protein Leryth_014005 [Lithospermum erythrorhizon]|nr:hypothetical protein Leryth_014005 [Lithospermum erythrorhizon]
MQIKKMKMEYFYSLVLFIIFTCNNLHITNSQPSTTGYTCSTNQTTYPCQTYVYYRPFSPNYLNLASIGDLFSVSRLMISRPSNINISSVDAPLQPNQSLFVPIQCSCNRVNTSLVISYAPLNHTIQFGDTFYQLSIGQFGNLTTFQSVEAVNPTLTATNLEVGVNAVFPIFCKCPNETLRQNGVSFLISYVFQPSDNISRIASLFNSTTQAIFDVNGNIIQDFDTIFVPVSQLPLLSQPAPGATSPPPAPSGSGNSTQGDDRKGAVIGLSIGLAICGLLLLILIIWLLCVYKQYGKRKGEGKYGGEGKHQKFEKGKKGEEVNLLADVSDCLDKYKVYRVDDLREATDDFDERYVIEGSVYRASIDDELYAIKKMNWNASEELKILQKVNHGNLVKLDGFCIDHEEATCYLVYEYVENGSLHSWLHGNQREKLSWKNRLRIAIDVANGLQYIHEHTRPKVVHKDIKSSNILLDSNMRAKIANFGLAKSGCNAITMHIVGTQGYIAPEYLADGVVSTKIDIFAFGVVLLELISGREAVDKEGKVLWEDADKILEGKEDKKMKRVKDWMDSSLLRESLSMESVASVMAVAVACLHRDPSRRPSMVDIVYTLCKSDDFSFDVSDEGLSPRHLVAR